MEALSGLLAHARKRQLPLDELLTSANIETTVRAMIGNARAKPKDRAAALELLCSLPGERRDLDSLLVEQLTANAPRELFKVGMEELAKRVCTPR